MNGLKKAGAILLLSIFVLAQVGHHLVFELAKWDAKKMIASDMHSNRFIHVIEKIEESASIHWEEKDHEFVLNGQMYDVIKQEQVGKKKWYYCINDNNETNLLTVYNQWMQSGNSSQDHKAKLALKYSSIECLLIKTFDKEIFLSEINQKWHTNFSAVIARPLYVDAPPPQNIA